MVVTAGQRKASQWMERLEESHCIGLPTQALVHTTKDLTQLNTIAKVRQAQAQQTEGGWCNRLVDDDNLLAYGLSKSAITHLKTGSYKVANLQEETLWEKKVFFKKVISETFHATAETRNHNS